MTNEEIVLIILMQKCFNFSEIAFYVFVLILVMSYFIGDNISRKIK